MEKAIYTIGYEGLTADAFVAALKKAKIQTLLDIRAVPLSRKPGFSKNKLKDRLAEDGIRYIGLKGLGTPASGRDAARKKQTALMHRIFKAHMKTKEAQADLQTALEAAAKERSCLLCFEHDEQCCHRLVVAEIMAGKAGFKIRHIDALHPLAGQA
jgi:uncharacterized protein (DUF488 family)